VYVSQTANRTIEQLTIQWSLTLFKVTVRWLKKGIKVLKSIKILLLTIIFNQNSSLCKHITNTTKPSLRIAQPSQVHLATFLEVVVVKTNLSTGLG